MKIIVENLGKKYRNEWIFKNFDYEFNSGECYAFIGPNGSGKSTILQVIAGITPQTQGKISYFDQNQENLCLDDIYKKLVIAAPYLELIEEFTLTETIEFQRKFKNFRNTISTSQIIDLLQLESHKNKNIKNFSSGMKQRLKLGLAFYADAPIILLDEPTSNLDTVGINWYLDNVREHTKNRLVIICSNQTYEYEFCKNVIDIRDFK